MSLTCGRFSQSEMKMLVSSPAHNLGSNRQLWAWERPKGMMAVAGEVWDVPPHTCYWPDAPVVWTSYHRLPGWSPPPFVRGGSFVCSRSGGVRPP